MNEIENALARAEVNKKAQLAQNIQNTEAVKAYATKAKRLISHAPFDGADAPQVAEVLAWLDATIRGSDEALVLLNMESQGKLTLAPTPPPPPRIKPEVVDDGK